MMDASGANTTAAAAVVVAGKHLDLSSTNALVLAATGPVGQRVAKLLVGAGAKVNVASRSLERATSLVEQISQETSDSANSLTPVSTGTDAELQSALNDIDLVIAAGAAGVELLSKEFRVESSVKVAIDLNAVPPLGLAGIEITDKAKDYNGQICYGAIGVGGTKMKIHKAAIQAIFEANDRLLDAEEIYQIGLNVQ